MGTQDDTDTAPLFSHPRMASCCRTCSSLTPVESIGQLTWASCTVRSTSHHLPGEGVESAQGGLEHSAGDFTQL